MEFFRIKKDIPFMKYALILNAISMLTFVLAVFFLVSRGLHLSVEFTGGTVMQVAYQQPADVGKIREQVSQLGYPEVLVQNVGSADRVMIRLPSVVKAQPNLLSIFYPMAQRTELLCIWGKSPMKIIKIQ